VTGEKKGKMWREVKGSQGDRPCEKLVWEGVSKRLKAFGKTGDTRQSFDPSSGGKKKGSYSLSVLHSR